MNVYRLVTLGLGSMLLVSSHGVWAQSDYQKWLQSQSQSFNQYVEQQDQEFTSFLKKQWAEFRVFAGDKRDPTPKPKQLPVAPKPKPEPQIKSAQRPVVKVKPKPLPKPEPIKPPAPRTTQTPTKEPEAKGGQMTQRQTQTRPTREPRPRSTPSRERPTRITPPTKKRGTEVRVDFFGIETTLLADPAIGRARLSGSNNRGVADYWAQLSKTRYKPLVADLQQIQKHQQLNDWVYAALARHVGQQIYRGRENESRLFAWFVLSKSGYAAQVGYGDNRIYLLLPSKQKLYETAYFNLGGKRYYLVNFDGRKERTGKLYTYKGSYPGATQTVDLNLPAFPALARSERPREVRFSFKGKQHTIRVNYNQNAVKFLNTYPQTDLDVYFNAAVQTHTGRSLLAQLHPLVEGMSEEDAVNLLLRFIQKGFPYKTDDGQFGFENYLFPEETLFYPYSDCEDRSFLFAWLVKNLIGLEVVGLTFPGHVATAVAFSNNAVAGDSVTYRGKRYVVADPTYINANAGMTMPSVKRSKPKVVPII